MNCTQVDELIRSKLEPYLQEEGIALYSGCDALRPGRYYLMGYNPAKKLTGGGSGNYTHLGKEVYRSGAWSSYTDHCWHMNDGQDCKNCSSKRTYDGHQIKVSKLIAALDGDETPQSVFATNAFFIATPRAACLRPRAKELWKLHWSIHEKFLSHVRPKFIITLGNGELDSAYAILRDTMGGHSSPESGYSSKRKWKTFTAKLFSEDVSVVGLRHPSYNYNNLVQTWSEFLQSRAA